MIDKKSTPAPGSRCPTCRKPTVAAHRPFCSKRCADIDLARWLGGTFVIPGSPLDVADDSAAAPPDESATPRSDAGSRRR